MSLTASIIDALEGQGAPLAGKDIATLAGLPYKSAIDALDRMLDAGHVARIGRKKSSRWSLVARAPAAPKEIDSLEAQWHGRGTPTPTGGGRGTTPPPIH